MVSDAMSLKEFTDELRKLVGNAEGMRPLLCQGNPLTTVVAIVGINPRTTTPFWPFWNVETGMNRKGWIEAYRALHGGKFGHSRAAIERFMPQVLAPVIELNAYVTQSNRIADLAPPFRKTNVLGFVLEAVRPKVIVCAGVSALKAIRGLEPAWGPTIVEAPHFIYWGKDSEAALTAHVNAHLRVA